MRDNFEVWRGTKIARMKVLVGVAFGVAPADLALVHKGIEMMDDLALEWYVAEAPHAILQARPVLRGG